MCTKDRRVWLSGPAGFDRCAIDELELHITMIFLDLHSII